VTPVYKPKTCHDCGEVFTPREEDEDLGGIIVTGVKRPRERPDPGLDD